MVTFVRVASSEEIPPGTRRRIDVDGYDVTILNVDGRLAAVGSRCPHEGGPLGDGEDPHQEPADPHRQQDDDEQLDVRIDTVHELDLDRGIEVVHHEEQEADDEQDEQHDDQQAHGFTPPGSDVRRRPTALRP